MRTFMQSAKCSLATAVAALAAIFLTGARAESPQIEGGQIADAAPDASVAPSILEKRRLETEQDEHRRWQEEQRRQEAKEREDHDYNRWRRFIEVGKLWEEAKLAGNLLEALEQQPAEADALYGGRTSAEWMDWARERHEALDPSNWKIDALWKDPLIGVPWCSKSGFRL
jgi:hypothetical protein